MTKNGCILIIASAFLCSFDHEKIGPWEILASPFVNASMINWSDLPEKYRDAPSLINTAGVSAPAIPGTSIVKTHGPYGAINGASFGLFPAANSVIVAIGVGGTASMITNITIWYKGVNGGISKIQAGRQSTELQISFRELGADEYVNAFTAGRSGIYISYLSIKTNKNNSVTAGDANSAVKYSQTIPAGFWLYGIWGYASATQIYQVNFNVHCKPWVVQSGSAARDIAVAKDGTVYMINSNGLFYKMTPNGASWAQLGGSDGRSIAANGNRVCMTNTAGKIYERIGETWKQLSGSDAEDIAIGSDNKIWITNTDGEIYFYKDASRTWERMTDLHKTGDDLHKAYRIAAGKELWALAKHHIPIVDDDLFIYRWNGTHWLKLSMFGPDGKDIAVADDGNVWVVDVDGKIYHNFKNPTTGNDGWDEMCGSSGRTISSNNNKVILTNEGGAIYKLTY